MFKIVVVGWNCDEYIERCLESVIKQKHTDWQMCVILDPCDDNSFDVATKAVAPAKDKILLSINAVKKYGMENQIEAIRRMRPVDNDVIVWLDGDDWLSGDASLQIVSDYYTANPDILVTHGSWTSFPEDPAGWHNNRPYQPSDFQKNIRHTDWRASHLRTMKFKVWRVINDKDFRGPDGKYLTTAIDCAAMWPALEIAGHSRVQFIPEKIHIYNRETLNGDWKLRANEQTQVAEYIRSLPPYECRESFEPKMITDDQLAMYLKMHERDIIQEKESYGNLRQMFVKMIGREPGL